MARSPENFSPLEAWWATRISLQPRRAPPRPLLYCRSCVLYLSPHRCRPCLVTTVEIACLDTEFVQQSSRRMAALAYFAVDDDGTVAECIEVVSERVDGYIRRPFDSPRCVLLCSTYVDDCPSLRDEPADLLRIDDVTVAAQYVFSHVAKQVDRVLGRRERRGVGQFEVSQSVGGDTACHRRCNHVDSLVNSVPANDLCTEDGRVVRVEDQLHRHSSCTGVVGRVVKGV